MRWSSNPGQVQAEDMAIRRVPLLWPLYDGPHIMVVSIHVVSFMGVFTIRARLFGPRFFETPVWGLSLSGHTTGSCIMVPLEVSRILGIVI